MNKFYKNLLAASLLLIPTFASADEGMWMINAIDKALEKNMKERGLKLSAGEIYNADAEGATLSDAIVSLDFGCSGSVISDEGLVITNHHCAYADVHKLSTPQMNYLDRGFWAMTSAEERHIEGKAIWFLKKVVDVTEQTNALQKQLLSEGKKYGMRKISYLMEKQCAEEGYEVMFSSMWCGSKYYMAYYKVYRDIRLVAAPPVSIAAFGGDTDNWEWPQHKCDFAMYRIYTAPDGSPATYSENNVPLKPKRKLKISLNGYKPGDFTMVIGYPGRTDRYSSSAKVRFEEDVTLPICTELRGKQMEIIKAAMDRDADIRLKYSDRYFSLSNVQELQVGTKQCFKRFKVAEEKAKEEKLLAEWIAADAARTKRWGELLDKLTEKFSATAEAEKDITYYRETLIRGCQLALASTRISSACGAVTKQGKNEISFEAGSTARNNIDKLYGSIDLALEKELFAYSLEIYFRNVSPVMFGSYQQQLLSRFCQLPAERFKSEERLGESLDSSNLEEMVEWMWNNSFLTSNERLQAYIAETHSVEECLQDPVVNFYKDVRVVDFNQRISKIEGKKPLLSLNREYTHALYQMRLEKGIAQYPDANSTMRITYGTVGALKPRDAVQCSWRSTTAGILQKNDPTNYDFCLNEQHKSLLESKDWGRWYKPKCKGKKAEDACEMPVDFICDCDITGGNSGSAVMNGKGEIIGLAFDGNKESLAGDASFTEGYNKCVCVDIRHVLWILDKYAGMQRIIQELGF